MKELKYVSDALGEVEKFGLTAEVIIWALKAMKENPELSILQAFESGCTEWDV